MSKQTTITTFSELYEKIAGGNSLAALFLPGHLAIEFLMRKLLVQYDSNIERLIEALKHAQLIQLGFDVGILSHSQKDVLLEINTIRNKLAHRITYEPKVSDLRKLWDKAARAFSDLSDGISQGAENLNKIS
ncbi:MAG: hypothetical protein AAFY56_14150, partial [Pseudomonadota bacterium]